MRKRMVILTRLIGLGLSAAVFTTAVPVTAVYADVSADINDNTDTGGGQKYIQALVQKQ